MDAIGALRPVAVSGPAPTPDSAPAPTADGALVARATEAPDPPAADRRGDNGAGSGRRPGEYTGSELAQLRELRSRDREVRAHEQAHAAAAGPHAVGGPSYTFETGPDGRRYAVAGEVQIDTSAAADPAATLAKARQIRRAALAPAEPSPQDRRVAAEAVAMAAKARAELAGERYSAAYPGEDATGAAALIEAVV